MAQKLPVDQVYENGIMLDTEHVNAGAVQETSTGIDWEQQIDVTEDVLHATQTIATQMHYGLMSQVLMCGQILSHDMDQTTLCSQRLAAILSGYKLDGANTWGRYLGYAGGEAQVADDMKTYYRQLFSETDVRSAFIGMEVLGGPVAYTVYDQLQKSKADAIVRAICEQLRQQKEEELNIAISYLQPELAGRAPAERNKLAEAARNYLKHAETVIGGNSRAASVLDIDIDAVMRQLKEQTAQFYSRIGIEL
jgi:hypothetical protein